MSLSSHSRIGCLAKALSPSCIRGVYQRRAYMKTSSEDPSQLSDADVGKLYSVPNEVVERLNFRKDLPSRFARQLETLDECTWLCRQPFLEARDYIRATVAPSAPAIRLVLWGQFGTGKSITMWQLLHYAHAQGFVVFSVRNVMDYTRRAGKHMEIQMSTYREGRIDVPDLSAKALALFKQQNAPLWDKLQSLTTGKDYNWTKLETLAEGKPITDIVEMGLASETLAPDCVGALGRELRRHATAGSIRLLVALDYANSLYGKMELVNTKHKILRPTAENVTLVSHLRKFLRHDWTNGACVLVADKAEISDARDSLTVPIDSPIELFGVEGFRDIDPFVPIMTQRYTEQELDAVYDYYKDSDWLVTEKAPRKASNFLTLARTEEGRTQMKFLSAFSPHYFERLCAFN